MALVDPLPADQQRRPEIAKAFIAPNEAVMDPCHGVTSEFKRLT